MDSFKSSKPLSVVFWVRRFLGISHPLANLIFPAVFGIMAAIFHQSWFPIVLTAYVVAVYVTYTVRMEFIFAVTKPRAYKSFETMFKDKDEYMKQLGEPMIDVIRKMADEFPDAKDES